MPLAARIHRVERGHERQTVDLAGTVRDTARSAIDVVIEDLSRTGFRIQHGPALAIDDSISLGLPGMGVRAASVVRRGSNGYGCEFVQPLGAAELDTVVAGLSNAPIPFPSPYAGLRDDVPSPDLRPYPRRVRLLGLLGLAAMSWGAVLVVVALV